jgi:4-oxalocrotonate tautomerase
MPVVTVQWWAGRTIEQKKKLIEGITSVMTDLGVPAEAIHIVIHDIPKNNWAHAGKLASEEPSS